MTRQEFGDGACGKQRRGLMWRRKGTERENGEECEIDDELADGGAQNEHLVRAAIRRHGGRLPERCARGRHEYQLLFRTGLEGFLAFGLRLYE